MNDDNNNNFKGRKSITLFISALSGFSSLEKKKQLQSVIKSCHSVLNLVSAIIIIT